MNGGILKTDFENWAHSMGGLIHPPSLTLAMFLWTLMCLLYGIVGVWIYAAIQPRYGAGPRTAFLTGLLLWTVSKLTVALDFISIGILPSGLIAGQLIGGFVALMAGTLLGARFYQD